MGKINLLDSSVYNHISAGEVVTNPSAVVKELVENSIDAGADKITIEIEGGGITKIRVIDDGSGIEQEDVKKAFLSHATSKINSVDDIFHIETLGFRGEALASIGAVSKANIITKTKDADVGTYMEIDGGVFGELSERATTDGTAITVSNLFYNTPARLKFLKQPRFEQNDVNKTVARFILGHPEINFTYLVDGEIFYQSPSGSLSDAIYSVYGADFLQEMVEVNRVDNGMRISGFICTPFGCKNNTSWQNTYINGRWVDSKCVSIACFNAYSDFIMKGKFPAFILNIEMDPRDVDINVSPQKTEAKFVRDSEVFAFVYSTVLQVLQKHEKDIEEKESIEALVEAPIINKSEDNKINVSSFNPFKYQQTNQEFDEQPTITVEQEKPTHYNDTTVKIFDDYNEPLFEEQVESLKLNSESSVMSEIMKKDIEKIHTTLNQNTFLDGDPFKIVGVAFTTYIIVESNETLYIIDQHAAHERVLYDKFVEEMSNGKLPNQTLMIPYILKTNYEESNFIEQNKETLEQLGFEFEAFGNSSYKVVAVPGILSDMDLDIFFQDIFSDISYLSNQNNLIKDKIATKACRSAVKAGDRLSDSEIELLIKMVNSSDTPLQCPHGRPFVVKVTKTELEKWFKRIV